MLNEKEEENIEKKVDDNEEDVVNVFIKEGERLVNDVVVDVKEITSWKNAEIISKNERMLKKKEENKEEIEFDNNDVDVVKGVLEDITILVNDEVEKKIDDILKETVGHILRYRAHFSPSCKKSVFLKIT